MNLKLKEFRTCRVGPRCCAAAANHKPGSATIRCDAFTLMEVMIAIGVFCIGVFAILDVVASVLHGARLLDKPMVDSGVIASEIAQTNSIVDGSSGFGYLDEFLGKPYQGYAYAFTINEVQSNRLYQADIAVTSDAPGKPTISKISILLFRPQSPPGRLDSGYMNSQ